MTGSADLWYYLVQATTGLVIFVCGYVVARLSRARSPVITETTFVHTVDADEVRLSVWILLQAHVDLEQSELHRSTAASMTVSDLALNSYRRGRLDGLKLACVIVNPQAEAELAGVGESRAVDAPSTSDDEETKRDG